MPSPVKKKYLQRLQDSPPAAKRCSKRASPFTKSYPKGGFRIHPLQRNAVARRLHHSPRVTKSYQELPKRRLQDSPPAAKRCSKRASPFTRGTSFLARATTALPPRSVEDPISAALLLGCRSALLLCSAAALLPLCSSADTQRVWPPVSGCRARYRKPPVWREDGCLSK